MPVHVVWFRQIAQALEAAPVLDKVWESPTWDGTMTQTCKRMAGHIERAMAAHGALYVTVVHTRAHSIYRRARSKSDHGEFGRWRVPTQ